MAKVEKNYIERGEQNVVVAWFNLAYPNELLYCIPNQLVRGKLQAIHMKKQGLVAGIPDLCLACPSKTHHGLYIEMKRPKGVTSKEQKNIIAHLISKGYAAYVCNGFEEAQKIIVAYMKNT